MAQPLAYVPPLPAASGCGGLHLVGSACHGGGRASLKVASRAPERLDPFPSLRLLREAARAAAELHNELSLGDPPSPEPARSAETAPASGYASIVEAAQHFGVSAHTVRRRVLSREWPSVRVGRQIRINLALIVSKRRAG